MNYSTYLKIEATQTGLHEKFTLLLSNELQWYEKEAVRLLGKKRLPTVKDDQLIQQILPKSPNDAGQQSAGPTYYAANVVAYLKVCRGLLSQEFIERFDSKSPLDGLVIYNYHRLFQGLLFDSLVLLNEYCENVERATGVYGCGRNPLQHHATLYQSLRQAIFGQRSFHSCIEVEPALAISIIRQLVELRIRRAFGVLGWYQPASQSIEPLPMGTLFEEIAKHRDDIDLSMPLECLTRIYGWSNIFLHSGIKDHSWKPLFVKEYIKEFCLGKQNPYNVNGGVVVTKAALAEIVASLNVRHPAGAIVLECSPEAIIRDG
jgi:hypothetical protein